MPNWCSNRLQVRGDWKEFKEKAGDVFKLSTFLPVPGKETAAKESQECWLRKSAPGLSALGDDEHFWRLQYWGTKWDVEGIWDIDAKTLITSFDSAWSPPEAAIQAISALFPSADFTLEYAERSMDFCGETLFKAGQVLESKDGSFSQTHGGDDCDEFPLMWKQEGNDE